MGYDGFYVIFLLKRPSCPARIKNKATITITTDGMETVFWYMSMSKFPAIMPAPKMVRGLFIMP